MKTMDKVYEIQAALRKHYTSKRGGNINLSIYDKADKTTHNRYSKPDADVQFLMSIRGRGMECRERMGRYSRFPEYVWTVSEVAGFKSVELTNEDAKAMELLFRHSFRATPGEFKKIEFPKAGKGFDLVVDMWHDLLVNGGAKTFAKGQAAVIAKAAGVERAVTSQRQK